MGARITLALCVLLVVVGQGCVLFGGDIPCASAADCPESQAFCDVQAGICSTEGPLEDAGRLIDDAGTPDAGVDDAGALDAGDPDAGALDAGANDAGPLDAGANDAGALDAGDPDAGVVDAGVDDAGAVDAGALIDAGPDGGLVDGGPLGPVRRAFVGGAGILETASASFTIQMAVGGPTSASSVTTQSPSFRTTIQLVR